MNIPARFIEADVSNPPYDLQDFDIAFASWGSLCWISDLTAWKQTASRALKPGGQLVLIDGHPAGWMLNHEGKPGAPLQLRDPYASSDPIFEKGQGSYADEKAILDRPRCVLWAYGFESLFMSMLGTGLTMRGFREFDCVTWPMPSLVKVDEYYWKLPESIPYVPLSFSLDAERIR